MEVAGSFSHTQASACTVLYPIEYPSAQLLSCPHAEFVLSLETVPSSSSPSAPPLPSPPGRVNFSSVPMVASYTFISVLIIMVRSCVCLGSVDDEVQLSVYLYYPAI